jgi:MFS family permease
MAVAVFGLGDFSHTLLILAATQLLTPKLGVVEAAQVAGLLYVLRNIVQIVISYPVGALADRVGSQLVLQVGYALGALTAALMALAFTVTANLAPLLTTIFVVAGIYVAVQETLEPSAVAEFAPQGVRGTAYGALGAVNGVGKLFSSIAVGFLWTAASPALAFGAAAAVMLAGTLALVIVRSDR